MNTAMESLQTAQWVLERNLGWIAAAETKVGVVVAIDTAMLGGLGAAFSGAETAARTQQWVFCPRWLQRSSWPSAWRARQWQSSLA